MESPTNSDSILSDVKIHVKFKLSALWAAVMFCYLYGDFFGLFKPGTIADILNNRTGALGTQTGLLAAAVLMAIPSVMVFLSLALSAKPNRSANLILGLLYTVIIILTMIGAWWFYLFLGVVEAFLTLAVAWLAWKWPPNSPLIPPLP